MEIKQSITVRDVNLLADDVSRLRQAWIASNIPVFRGPSESPPNGDGVMSETGTCTASGATVLFDESGNSDDVRLVFAGKDLQEGRPLLEYGLGRDSTVHVLGRLRGGAQLGKVVKGRSQVFVIVAHETH